MSKKQVIWLFVFIVVAAFAIIGGLNLMEKARFSAWERMLKGPYLGAEASAPGASTNLSLSLANGTTLTLFEDADQGTVLSFRDVSGQSRWSRLLIAEEQSKEGNGTNRTKLRNVSFQEVKKTKDGLKVVFICDWDWGGREQGVIYLSPELDFRSFAVGW